MFEVLTEKMTAERLVENTQQRLMQREGIQAFGNRPHYPICLMLQSTLTGAPYREIYGRMARIWPQIMRHIAAFGYAVTTDGKMELHGTEGEKSRLAERDIMAYVNETAKSTGIFKEMSKWHFYHLIDTAEMRSLEEFTAHYMAGERGKELLANPCKSMVIILLHDEKASGTDLAEKIREYLSEHNIYDSTILISDRLRNNQICDRHVLYRIVADVLILSVNDAVTTADDEDYARRTTVLYSGLTLIVSYLFMERPNRRIALQMNGLILREAAEENKAGERKNADEETKRWVRNGYCECCESFLSDLPMESVDGLLSSLPMKSGAAAKKANPARQAYTEFRSCLADENTLTVLQEAYLKARISESELQRLREEYRQSVLEEFAPSEIRVLDNRRIDDIIRRMETGHLNPQMSASEYFRQSVKIAFREGYFYPLMKQTLAELAEAAHATELALKRVMAAYQELIPVDGYTELGTMYEKAVKDFVGSKSGKQCLQRITAAGNGEEEILAETEQCFAQVLAHEKELFTLSFVEEWEKRLHKKGEMIYKEISKTLTGDGKDRIQDRFHLYGNYVFQERLKVFMLHTTDPDGVNHPTPLYSYLQKTFSEDKSVQYFNTGYDDELEALLFAEVNGINLRL